jgi:hypothetical protein
MVRLRCVYISLHILLYKTIERNRFFFFFCNISGAADLIDGIDASKCIYEYCVIKASSNLSSSRPSKIYMLGCIVVETSFIKLNIACSASDNQQKYITHTHDIRSSSSSFVVNFFFFSIFYRCCSRCCTHPQASTFEYISRASMRVRTTNRFILLTTTIQLAAYTHIYIKRSMHF